MKQTISLLEQRLASANKENEQLSSRPDIDELEAQHARNTGLEQKIDEQTKLIAQLHANMGQYVSDFGKKNLALAAENRELKAAALLQDKEIEALRAEMSAQIAHYQLKSVGSRSTSIERKEDVTT